MISSEDVLAKRCTKCAGPFLLNGMAKLWCCTWVANMPGDSGAVCVCVSVCVKDGWRWNADHAGTLVWHGWESWHKNIAHCNSGYHVPVLTKHGDPQQPTQLHWEHLKGFSISTIVLNYVWSVCQGRGGTDTANFSSFLKKTKTIMFSYYKQTDQWGENKLWRPEAGISRGIWHLPFMEEQT